MLYFHNILVSFYLLASFSKKILINHIVYSHVDSNQNTETFKLSEPEHVDDAFGDDDDGFDLLLSQIDTTEAVQSSSTFTILSKKTLHQSNGVPPKSALELPTTSKGIYFFKNQDFKCIKSTGAFICPYTRYYMYW